MLGYTVADIDSTAGLSFAIAYVVFTLLCFLLHPKKRSPWAYAGILICQTAVLLAIVIAFNSAYGLRFVSAVCFNFLATAGALKWGLKLNARMTIYWTVRVYILSELAASIEWQIFYYGIRYLGFPRELWVNDLIMAGVYILTFGTAYLLEVKYRGPNEDLDVRWKQVWLVFAIGLTAYVIGNISYAQLGTLFSVKGAPERFITRTLADVAGVGYLLAYHIGLHESRITMEKNTMDQLMKANYRNYQITKESMEIVNRKYHDLKHQIALLKTSATAVPESLRELENMEKEIHIYENQYRTGNQILDTILMSQSLQAEICHIRINCVAEGQLLDFMSAFDMSSLFGNALDNAREYLAQVEDPDRRLIHVMVVRKKKFVVVKIENYCETELTYKDGIPQSTKEDSVNHGYGIKSMQKIVEKYGGILQIEPKEKWFCLQILFPFTQVK